MNYFQQLKNFNLLEWYGTLLKKDQKKVIAIFSILLIGMILLLRPVIINAYQFYLADRYIKEAQPSLDAIASDIEKGTEFLERNKTRYKELELYQTRLGEEKEKFKNLTSKFDVIKNDLENKEVENVLWKFETKTEEKTILFQDRITSLAAEVESINSDIFEVIELDRNLLSSYDEFTQYKEKLPDVLKKQYDSLLLILEKGRTDLVKDKAKKYYADLSESAAGFNSGLDRLTPFTKEEQGEFSLAELRGLTENYKQQNSLLLTSKSDMGDFYGYLNKLKTQYYSIVTKQYSETITEYKTERNPKYDRFDEDSKEPEMISVPYEFDEFYYTEQWYYPSEVTTNEVCSGRRSARNYSFYDQWRYQPNEQVGYVQWKPLWDDVILTGMNLSPVLIKEE